MPKPTSPFKRVRREFDRTALQRVCAMHETEFADAYDMAVTPCRFQRKGDEYGDFFAFKDNGSQILAVAHLDTVMPHNRRAAHFLDTAAGPVVYSGALDDRLGAYSILELLPTLGVNCDILLTTGEESGESTAQFFEPPKGKEYNWMIEFDRGGTDVVMYQYEDGDTIDLVRASGAKVGNGIFSDIAYLEHLEIKGFNWGVGYRDYHGPRSHAFLEDYWMMLGHYLKFHEENAETYLPHDAVASSYFGGYRTGGNLWSTWGDDRWDDEVESDAQPLTEVLDGDLVSEDFTTVNGQLLPAHEHKENQYR